MKFSAVPERTAKELDTEIERTRKEIVELQSRIRRMVIKRHPQPSEIAGVHPRILKIDAQIERARRVVQANPQTAVFLQKKIDALEMERYRLLLQLDET